MSNATESDGNIACLKSSLQLSVADGPTKVMVNLYVRSFEKIDDVKMEFSVQITFREEIFRFFKLDHSLVNMLSCAAARTGNLIKIQKRVE